MMAFLLPRRRKAAQAREENTRRSLPLQPALWPLLTVHQLQQRGGVDRLAEDEA